MDEIYVDIKDQKSGVTGTCQLFIVNFPGPIKKENTTSNEVSERKLKFIVDCGLFQGEKSEQELNNSSFDFDPFEISFALLTHAHVDHYGRFPRLVRKGFINPIFMTKTTGLLLNAVALDDCMRLTKKQAKRSHRDPLYTEKDLRDFKKNMVLVNFNTKIVYSENISFYFFQNGHLPGAACILVKITYPGCRDVNIFLTGDYATKNMFFPVADLPSWVKTAKGLTLISEATYGSTNTYDLSEPCLTPLLLPAITGEKKVDFSPTLSDDVCNLFSSTFVNTLLQTINVQKKILFYATYSLGRAQELLFLLKILQDIKLLPTTIPIYFDGYTTQEYTTLFVSGCFPMYPNATKFLPENLTFVTGKPMRAELVKDLNSKIIISSSGMMTYGPSQYYVQKLINCPQAVIHATGYVSPESVAGKLKNANDNDNVNINGVTIAKRAQFFDTTAWSAHAKSDELLNLYNLFKGTKSIILHHGNPETKEFLAEKIVTKFPDLKVGVLSNDVIFRITADGIENSYSTNLI